MQYQIDSSHSGNGQWQQQKRKWDLVIAARSGFIYLGKLLHLILYLLPLPLFPLPFVFLPLPTFWGGCITIRVFFFSSFLFSEYSPSWLCDYYLPSCEVSSQKQLDWLACLTVSKLANAWLLLLLLWLWVCVRSCLVATGEIEYVTSWNLNATVLAQILGDQINWFVRLWTQIFVQRKKQQQVFYLFCKKPCNRRRLSFFSNELDERKRVSHQNRQVSPERKRKRVSEKGFSSFSFPLSSLLNFFPPLILTYMPVLCVCTYVIVWASNSTIAVGDFLRVAGWQRLLVGN